MFNDDCDPKNDALDALFWGAVERAMLERRTKLDEEAKTRNSISFRRELAVFDRADRIARRELQKAAQKQFG